MTLPRVDSPPTGQGTDTMDAIDPISPGAELQAVLDEGRVIDRPDLPGLFGEPNEPMGLAQLRALERSLSAANKT